MLKFFLLFDFVLIVIDQMTSGFPPQKRRAQRTKGYNPFSNTISTIFRQFYLLRKKRFKYKNFLDDFFFWIYNLKWSRMVPNQKYQKYFIWYSGIIVHYILNAFFVRDEQLWPEKTRLKIPSEKKYFLLTEILIFRITRLRGPFQGVMDK